MPSGGQVEALTRASFRGFITSSAAPIGALGDVLAAAINPNVGSSQLAPMATEIEVQKLYQVVEKQPELQAFTQNLSITTFSDLRWSHE